MSVTVTDGTTTVTTQNVLVVGAGGTSVAVTSNGDPYGPDATLTITGGGGGGPPTGPAGGDLAGTYPNPTINPSATPTVTTLTASTSVVTPSIGASGHPHTMPADSSVLISQTSGDARYLQSSNNLSDVASASTARTNLGLGSAATLAASAVCQTANNLSDVASASTCRTNLGLGSASTLASAAVCQTANNLSDVASASTARTNLGLGTAATLASSAVCQTANNLSDLGSASTARTNLGLGTAATHASGDFAASTLTVQGTAPVTINGDNSTHALTGNLTAALTMGSATPVVNGTATSGTATDPSHEDHVHPHDTATGVGAIAAGTANISIAQAASSSTVNLSTQGTIDWFTCNGSLAVVNWQNSDVQSKITGGWIFSTWGLVSGGVAGLTQFTGTTGVPTISTSAGDGCAASVLSAVAQYVGIYGTTSTQTGFGFGFRVPADPTTRVLRVYLSGYSGIITLTARLSDGSYATQSASVTYANGTSGHETFTVTYQATNPGQTLIVTAIVTTAYSDGGNVTFVAATLGTT